MFVVVVMVGLLCELGREVVLQSYTKDGSPFSSFVSVVRGLFIICPCRVLVSCGVTLYMSHFAVSFFHASSCVVAS